MQIKKEDSEVNTDCRYLKMLAQDWKMIELDKPLIGICAGFNNILRAIQYRCHWGQNKKSWYKWV